MRGASLRQRQPVSGGWLRSKSRPSVTDRWRINGCGTAVGTPTRQSTCAQPHVDNRAPANSHQPHSVRSANPPGPDCRLLCVVTSTLTPERRVEPHPHTASTSAHTACGCWDGFHSALPTTGRNGPTPSMWSGMTYWHSQPTTFQNAPRPFARSDLGARQITAHSLKTNPRYVRIFNNAWVDRDDEAAMPTPLWAGPTWLREAIRLRGFRLLRPDVVGTVWTAARLYGLPVPNRIRDYALHIAGNASCNRISRPGVVLHRHQFWQYDDFFDLPLLTVPHLFIEVAPFLEISELVQIGDAVVSTRFSGPSTSIEQLRAELRLRKQVRNRKLLEQAIALVRHTVDSPRETWLRLWIINHGFPEPHVHPEIHSHIKNIMLRPDLGYPELRLAIEYEGDQHRTSPEQFATDIERLQLIEAEGWTILRVSKRSDMAAFSKLLAQQLSNDA